MKFGVQPTIRNLGLLAAQNSFSDHRVEVLSNQETILPEMDELSGLK